MRVPVAIVFVVQLLLRGAAVPHTHPAHAACPDGLERPHVHLTTRAARHIHDHDRRRGNARPGTRHDGSDTRTLPDGDHDEHDAIYLDGNTPLITSAQRPTPADPTVDSVPGPPGRPVIRPARDGSAPCQVRPPGGGPVPIRVRFPHLLRA